MVERLADAVDPSPAQRRVDRLFGGDRRKARFDLVNLDPHLALGGVMRGQPIMETVHVHKFVNLVGIYLDGRHRLIPFKYSECRKTLMIMEKKYLVRNPDVGAAKPQGQALSTQPGAFESGMIRPDRSRPICNFCPGCHIWPVWPVMPCERNRV